MSYTTRATERLTLPSAPDYWVEFRTRLTFGDRVILQRALQDAVYEMAGGTQNLNFRAAVRLRADDVVLLHRVIVAWNLDNEHGAILPIDADSVLLLTEQDAQAIIDRVNELNPRRTPQEKATFRDAGIEPAERERGADSAIVSTIHPSAAVVD